MPKGNKLKNGDSLRVIPDMKEVKVNAMGIDIGMPSLKELAKRTDNQDSNAVALNGLCTLG